MGLISAGLLPAPPSPPLPLPPGGLTVWETEGSGQSEVGTASRAWSELVPDARWKQKATQELVEKLILSITRAGDLLPSPLQAASTCFLQVFFLPVPFIFVTFSSSFALSKLSFWCLFSATRICTLREMYESIMLCSTGKKALTLSPGAQGLHRSFESFSENISPCMSLLAGFAKCS